ncbi:mannonate dehydratase [Vibrio penaeicida]|uniref:mannonate dehydratase n=1 Tax=Vibrio penaeicida TaxID=104609 RepID=UPI0027371144|nr:mannonate dehydratase [Vibrio penaeicida]MDP2571723.1 mannonate dehydratase [Vibrio penaeicida]
MKIGIGLYHHMLNEGNFIFAKQIGVTHIVAHLTDYFSQEPRLPGTTDAGWGRTTGNTEVWEIDYLLNLKHQIEAHGLTLHAIENFDPAHWFDVLIGGPKRDEQLEYLKQIIINLGKAGIPVMGYNFSIAGVWGWEQGPYARGGAESVGLRQGNFDFDSPIPNGTIWNMQYDPNAPQGFLPPITHEQLWSNLRYFLEALTPVAEKAGVILAAHPDDPPMPTMRGHARLVYQPRYYNQLFDLVPSSFNRAELCIGSVAEMTEGNIYEHAADWSKRNKIGYVHLRNVKGKIPHYTEVFIDEGDVDIKRLLSVFHQNGFDGVVIPDHTPQLNCDAPWHSGMAYAIGYIKAMISEATKGEMNASQ